MGNILLAEDETVIRELLTEVLTAAGHDVIQAADGAEALARLPGDVDVIVTDVMMPRMTGVDWVTAARGRPGMGRVPVIFMSALPLPAVAASLATTFLAKPFTADRLVKAVQRSLDGPQG